MEQLKLTIFVIFVTAVLILTVALRLQNNSLFYKYRRINTRRDVHRQQLWQKQLEIESLLNPASLSEYINREE